MGVIARIGAVVCAALALLSAASGLSAADPLVGKTYKDAASAVASWGATAVIENVIGSQLPTDDCTVTRSQKSSFRDSAGRPRQSSYLLTINCNAQVATAGTPGNSAASPEGRTAKADNAYAKSCAEAEQAGDKNCESWCSWHESLCAAAVKAGAKEYKLDVEYAQHCAEAAQANDQNCATWCSWHTRLCTAAAQA